MLKRINPLIILPLFILLFLSCASVKSEIPVGPFSGVSLSPQEVKNILLERDRNLHGLKALGNFFIKEKDEGIQSFEGILFLDKPDRLRLQGMSFGTVIFDLLMQNKEPYLYLPSEKRISKITADDLKYLDEVFSLIKPYPSSLNDSIDDSFFLIEREPKYYVIYIGNREGAVMKKLWLDRGNLSKEKEELFNHEGSKKVSVTFTDIKQIEGNWYPTNIEIYDIGKGITISAELKKFIFNPVFTVEDFKFPE